MKTRFLIILFAGLVVFGLPGIVFGPPYFSEQDRYDSADVILTGEITSYFKPEAPKNLDSSEDTIYEVNVTQYIKNDLGLEILQVHEQRNLEAGKDSDNDNQGMGEGGKY